MAKDAKGHGSESRGGSGVQARNDRMHAMFDRANAQGHTTFNAEKDAMAIAAQHGIDTSHLKPGDQPFTASHLEQLRTEYSKIKTIDPSQPSYGKLTAMLSGTSQARLKQLAGAGIPFVSKLAANRVQSSGGLKSHFGVKMKKGSVL